MSLRRALSYWRVMALLYVLFLCGLIYFVQWAWKRFDPNHGDAPLWLHAATLLGGIYLFYFLQVRLALWQSKYDKHGQL